LLNIELEKLKDRMISATHLEKKRAIMEEKNKFAEAVIAAVKIEAGEFRNNPRYAEFLTKMIMEGARVVGSRSIDVFYSSADEKVLTNEFKSSLISLAKKEIDENILFSFKPAEFHDIGVIVQSSDGRLVCDNKFLSRFHAVYDDVYTRLLKEAG
ncbi:MAG: V-type ATP synthase subunit E family protein, partial [Candidatus Omnitrophica bacterium]|nr:V-type ATP synthase subunit E family protein [Candidatus Omnitrophota bacterium]